MQNPKTQLNDLKTVEIHTISFPMLEDGAVSYRYEYNDAGEVIKKTKYDYGDHEVE